MNSPMVRFILHCHTLLSPLSSWYLVTKPRLGLPAYRRSPRSTPPSTGSNSWEPSAERMMKASAWGGICKVSGLRRGHRQGQRQPCYLSHYYCLGHRSSAGFIKTSEFGCPLAWTVRQFWEALNTEWVIVGGWQKMTSVYFSPQRLLEVLSLGVHKIPASTGSQMNSSFWTWVM